MKANDVSLTTFLEQQDHHFVIPVYQRNYDWAIPQCDQLLDDIKQLGKTTTDDSHFIGSIVFIHAGVVMTDPPRKLVIIDGQQRLTTITLLWIVLYRIAKENGDEKQADEINKKYLVNEFLEDDEKLKLRSTSNNDKALRFLIKDGDPIDYPDYSRLISNFKFFKSEINKNNFKTVISGIRKLRFVEISLDRKNDDPQRIFESLNSTGLDLTQADLIRNYILMKLEPAHQEKIYEDYWKTIESLATEITTAKSKVSDFVRDFLTLKNKEIPNQNRVYLTFKKYYAFKDKASLETSMKEIKKYASHYNKLINPEQETDAEIRKHIKLIAKLEINICFPFVLNIYNDYHHKVIDKKTLIDVLELIQSFIWRRFIIGLPTQGLNRIFARLYEEIDTSDYMTSLCKALIKRKGAQRFPTDDETLRELKLRDVYNIKSNNRTYFLERLENHKNREPVKIEDNLDITIEHIFPQNPRPTWRKNIQEKEFKEIIEKYLHTIGNLTLSGNNGALGNKSFLEKRDLAEKGYSDSRLFLNKHLSTLEEWNKKEIINRTRMIEKRFKEIWTFPEVELDENDKNEEINIFDEDDATGKKLEYIVFFDDKIKISSFQELYKTIVSTLFEIQPETFQSTDLGKKIKLSASTDGQLKSKLRMPLKVSDNYFVEGNLSAQGIITRAQLALKTFKIFDSLFLKYK